MASPYLEYSRPLEKLEKICDFKLKRLDIHSKDQDRLNQDSLNQKLSKPKTIKR